MAVDERVKHVFVCGLHRSGTTALARCISELRDCTAFENTGVPKDEGQHLQDVYPPENAYGGPGRFGFSRGAHLTENSPLLTPANISKLRASWDAHWDQSKAVRVEKTPSNLLKARFLQAAFPNSYFVVIRRHPVAVSLATQKWTPTTLNRLFEHWLLCHEIFGQDRAFLSHVHELKYEEFVADPQKHLKQIAEFIGIDFAGVSEQLVDKECNARYIDRWAQMLHSPVFGRYYHRLARMYEDRFAAHGYSVTEFIGGRPFGSLKRNLLCRVADASFYPVADVWRASRLEHGRRKTITGLPTTLLRVCRLELLRVGLIASVKPVPTYRPRVQSRTVGSRPETGAHSFGL